MPVDIQIDDRVTVRPEFRWLQSSLPPVIGTVAEINGKDIRVDWDDGNPMVWCEEHKLECL